MHIEGGKMHKKGKLDGYFFNKYKIKFAKPYLHNFVAILWIKFDEYFIDQNCFLSKLGT